MLFARETEREEDFEDALTLDGWMDGWRDHFGGVVVSSFMFQRVRKGLTLSDSETSETV